MLKSKVNLKVKCTLVQALRLYTGCTAHRGSRSIALLFLDHDTRRVWEISVTPQPLSTPGKDPVPIVQKAGWAAGPIWSGAENLAPTRIFFFKWLVYWPSSCLVRCYSMFDDVRVFFPHFSAGCVMYVGMVCLAVSDIMFFGGLVSFLW